MFCPECGTEYREGFVECADCRVPLVARPPAEADEGDLDVLIETSLCNLIAISLAESLLREAGIPYFVMDRNSSARQESGNFLGFWTIRVPQDREAEAREILASVEREGA